MEFKRVSEDEWSKAVHETDGALIRVANDCELDDDRVKELDRIFRGVNSTNPSIVIDYEADESGDVQEAEIDIKTLWSLMYEHRRYTAARGFSDAEMNVLRAIEFHTAQRVGVDEIIDSKYTKNVSESMIYKSLRNLQDKDLIMKTRPGVYEYTGP